MCAYDHNYLENLQECPTDRSALTHPPPALLLSFPTEKKIYRKHNRRISIASEILEKNEKKNIIITPSDWDSERIPRYHFAPPLPFFPLLFKGTIEKKQ